MRLTILSLIGAVGLAVAANSASAAPMLAPEAQPNAGIVKVWGGCGPGFRPVPGHWSRWRGWIPPHCAPFARPWGPYGYHRSWGPYANYRPYW